MLAVGASRAAAETRSPYLAPLRLVLERVLELRGDDLPPKAKATLEKCLTAVADEGEGLENQLKVLAKVAALWERFPGEVAPSLLRDALVGFAAEIEEAAASVEDVKLKARAAGSSAARINLYVAAARAAVAQARLAGTVRGGAATLRRAAAAVSRALQLLGKLTPEVVVTWLSCDSIGWAGTPYVRGVNCRVVLVDGYPRRFVVSVPETGPYSEAVPAPLLLMHHGSTGTGEQFLGSSGWREKGEEVGLVSVYGTGLEYRLLENGGSRRSGTTPGSSTKSTSRTGPSGTPRTPRGPPTTSSSPAGSSTTSRPS